LPDLCSGIWGFMQDTLSLGLLRSDVEARHEYHIYMHNE